MSSIEPTETPRYLEKNWGIPRDKIEKPNPGTKKVDSGKKDKIEKRIKEIKEERNKRKKDGPKKRHRRA